MIEYLVQNCAVITEEHNTSNGSNGEYHSYASKNLTGVYTAEQLAKTLRAHDYLADGAKIEFDGTGYISAHTYQTSEGTQARESELALWRAGKLSLWYIEFEASIRIITSRPCVAEDMDSDVFEIREDY